MTTDDISEIRAQIESVLLDRCQNGWEIDVTQDELDDLAHVSVVFRDSSYRLDVSFRAFIDEDHALGAVKFLTHDDADEGEEVNDLLWQWLFWETIQRAGQVSKERDEARAKNRDNVAVMKGLIGERDAAIRERNEVRDQLLDVQEDLREEEKRHRKAAVDRDDLRAQLAAKDAEIERLNLERSQVLEAQRLGLRSNGGMLLPPEGVAVLLGIDSREAWDEGCPRLPFRSYMIAAGAYGLYIERGGTPIENDCAKPERFHGTGGGR